MPKPRTRKKKPPKRVLALTDLEQAKATVTRRRRLTCDWRRSAVSRTKLLTFLKCRK
jgi:hypothetical protein